MVLTVLLVNTVFGEVNRVLKKIKTVGGVEEAYALWGVYDIVIAIRTHSIDKLKEIINLHLRTLEGVSSILTLMVIQGCPNAEQL